MQALLIATGEENKLLPLTATLPSPMVPIIDRPVMVYALELLARAGIRDIGVALYEGASTIESYFGHGERWSVTLQYLLQRTAWGATGAVKRAEQVLTTTFLVLPADIMLDLDIKAALQFHQAHGGLATAILGRQATTLAPGLTIGEQNQLHATVKPGKATDTYGYTGAFILEPAALALLPEPGALDGQSDLGAALQQAHIPIHGYVADGYWNPLTTFREYQAAQDTVLTSLDSPRRAKAGARLRHAYIEAREIAPGIWVGPNSIVHPEVRLTAPLFIGAGCRIGANTELGPDTIIGAGSVIDEGVTIHHSTVLPHTYIGQFLHLAHRIANQAELIDVATGTNVQIADPWLLTAVNPALPGNLARNLAERALALLLLLVAAPLLLIVGVALWLTEGGPIFSQRQCFGQMPLVKGTPQLLNLYQFRTQRADHSASRLGHWLETTEIHRLPELWNVVRGEIGLVGVKPLSSEESMALQEAWQQGRFGAQAGFTGLWYTEATPTTDADELCIMDAYQAVAHTWYDDCRQLWRTPIAWWRRQHHTKRPKHASQLGLTPPQSSTQGDAILL